MSIRFGGRTLRKDAVGLRELLISPLDWTLAALWLCASLGAGLWFSRRASSSAEAFFVADRSLPWWVVGTSMVATTFAADTPLVVSGWVATRGIAENWTWWNVGLSGLVSALLFAPLWRRSGVVTDAELVELRYSGQAAAVLRTTKAAWFGVFQNTLVLAWVMRAMAKVAVVVLELEPGATWQGVPVDVWVVLALFVLTVGYTAAAGLYGVVATDVMQFVVAMGGAIWLAIVSWRAAGGLSGIQEGFARNDFDWASTTALIPVHDWSPDGAGPRFVLLVSVIWWAAYNVDGGGYLAQRLFAAKDARHAAWAHLWYTVALICLRPWPWVAVGLAGMAMLGPMADAEQYYPAMMTEVLGPGVLGLMVASFLAAFMSTIDTQLHWGATLVVNDLWRRWIRPDASEHQIVRASQLAVLGLATLGALVSFAIDDIGDAWKLAISVTAGLGSVYVARWLWWRVSAVSELTAMAVAMACTLGFSLLAAHHQGAEPELAWTWLGSVPRDWLAFPFSTAFTVAIGVPVWIGVTLFTSPTDPGVLRRFYDRVRPEGAGWRAVEPSTSTLPGGFIQGFVAGIVAIYGVLLGTGWWLLGSPGAGLASLCAAGLGAFVLGRVVRARTEEST